jgi:hypothetical protein
MLHRHRAVKVVLAIVSVLTPSATALAGGGEILPASAKAKGLSLADMAVITGPYNSGITSGNPDTPPPPPVPFEILIADTTVKVGTMIYLPIFFEDDSGVPPPGFPKDITDQKADAAFLNNAALTGFGVSAFIVQVDGKTTVMTDAYISGVTTAPLLDGTPPGTHYIISAAFLTPLTPGEHVVSIGGIVDGEPVAFITYHVTVR